MSKERGEAPASVDMGSVLLYLLGAAGLALAVIGGAILARGPLARIPLLANVFARKPGRRLDVLEQASIDGRRRLVLIRRDDVEHLIMTGGPVDVVIETGIRGTRGAEARETPAVLTRPQALAKAAAER